MGIARQLEIPKYSLTQMATPGRLATQALDGVATERGRARAASPQCLQNQVEPRRHATTLVESEKRRILLLSNDFNQNSCTISNLPKSHLAGSTPAASTSLRSVSGEGCPAVARLNSRERRRTSASLRASARPTLCAGHLISEQFQAKAGAPSGEAGRPTVATFRLCGEVLWRKHVSRPGKLRPDATRTS